MKKINYYQVATHLFSISGDENYFTLMTNYSVFSCAPSPDDALAFSLTISPGDAIAYTEEWRQQEEGQEIVCGHTAEGQSIFEFIWNGETAGWLSYDKNYGQGLLHVTGSLLKLAIDNALMVLFALTTANKGTALFHASTVSYDGRAYMFLGQSGTGKSTHARLWLDHIEGTELVNDDNPVVHIGTDGKPRVYGSPWSGKTPCYRHVDYPLGAVVLLSQAPYNKIRQLGAIETYAALVASISGKRWDSQIANGLYQTEVDLTSSVPTWLLECLPDAAAAELCHKTITT